MKTLITYCIMNGYKEPKNRVMVKIKENGKIFKSLS